MSSEAFKSGPGVRKPQSRVQGRRHIHRCLLGRCNAKGLQAQAPLSNRGDGRVAGLCSATSAVSGWERGPSALPQMDLGARGPVGAGRPFRASSFFPLFCFEGSGS